MAICLRESGYWLPLFETDHNNQHLGWKKQDYSSPETETSYEQPSERGRNAILLLPHRLVLPEWTGDHLFLDFFSKSIDSTAFSTEIDRLNENASGHLQMVDMASFWLHLLFASFETWAKKEGHHLCDPGQAQLPLNPSFKTAWNCLSSEVHRLDELLEERVYGLQHCHPCTEVLLDRTINVFSLKLPPLLSGTSFMDIFVYICGGKDTYVKRRTWLSNANLLDEQLVSYHKETNRSWTALLGTNTDVGTMWHESEYSLSAMLDEAGAVRTLHHCLMRGGAGEIESSGSIEARNPVGSNCGRREPLHYDVTATQTFHRLLTPPARWKCINDLPDEARVSVIENNRAHGTTRKVTSHASTELPTVSNHEKLVAAQEVKRKVQPVRSTASSRRATELGYEPLLLAQKAVLTAQFGRYGASKTRAARPDHEILLQKLSAYAYERRRIPLQSPNASVTEVRCPLLNSEMGKTVQFAAIVRLPSYRAGFAFCDESKTDLTMPKDNDLYLVMRAKEHAVVSKDASDSNQYLRSAAVRLGASWWMDVDGAAGLSIRGRGSLEHTIGETGNHIFIREESEYEAPPQSQPITQTEHNRAPILNLGAAGPKPACFEFKRKVAWGLIAHAAPPALTGLPRFRAGIWFSNDWRTTLRPSQEDQRPKALKKVMLGSARHLTSYVFKARTPEPEHLSAAAACQFATCSKIGAGARPSIRGERLESTSDDHGKVVGMRGGPDFQPLSPCQFSKTAEHNGLSIAPLTAAVRAKFPCYEFRRTGMGWELLARTHLIIEQLTSFRAGFGFRKKSSLRPAEEDRRLQNLKRIMDGKVCHIFGGIAETPELELRLRRTAVNRGANFGGDKGEDLWPCLRGGAINTPVEVSVNGLPRGAEFSEVFAIAGIKYELGAPFQSVDLLEHAEAKASLTDSYMVVDAGGVEYVSAAMEDEDEDVAMHDDAPERIYCELKVKGDWESGIPKRRTQRKKTRRKVRKDIAVWSSAQMEIGDSDEVEIRAAKQQRFHSPQFQSKVTIQDEPAVGNHSSPRSSSLFLRGGYTGKKRLRRQPVVRDHPHAYLSLVPGDISDDYFNIDVVPRPEDLGATEAYGAIEVQATISDAHNIKLLQRRRRKLYKESQADAIWCSTKAAIRRLSGFENCTTKALMTPASPFVRKALILSAGDSITQEDPGPNSVQRRESAWHASFSALPNRVLVTHDWDEQTGVSFPATHNLQQLSRASSGIRRNRSTRPGFGRIPSAEKTTADWLLRDCLPMRIGAGEENGQAEAHPEPRSTVDLQLTSLQPSHPVPVHDAGIATVQSSADLPSHQSLQWAPPSWLTGRSPALRTHTPPLNTSYGQSTPLQYTEPNLLVRNDVQYWQCGWYGHFNTNCLAPADRWHPTHQQERFFAAYIARRDARPLNAIVPAQRLVGWHGGPVNSSTNQRITHPLGIEADHRNRHRPQCWQCGQYSHFWSECSTPRNLWLSRQRQYAHRLAYMWRRDTRPSNGLQEIFRRPGPAVSSIPLREINGKWNEPFSCRDSYHESLRKKFKGTDRRPDRPRLHHSEFAGGRHDYFYRGVDLGRQFIKTHGLQPNHEVPVAYCCLPEMYSWPLTSEELAEEQARHCGEFQTPTGLSEDCLADTRQVKLERDKVEPDASSHHDLAEEMSMSKRNGSYSRPNGSTHESSMNHMRGGQLEGNYSSSDIEPDEGIFVIPFEITVETSSEDESSAADPETPSDIQQQKIPSSSTIKTQFDVRKPRPNRTTRLQLESRSKKPKVNATDPNYCHAEDCLRVDGRCQGEGEGLTFDLHDLDNRGRGRQQRMMRALIEPSSPSVRVIMVAGKLDVRSVHDKAAARRRRKNAERASRKTREADEKLASKGIEITGLISPAKTMQHGMPAPSAFGDDRYYHGGVCEIATMQEMRHNCGVSIPPGLNVSALFAEHTRIRGGAVEYNKDVLDWDVSGDEGVHEFCDGGIQLLSTCHEESPENPVNTTNLGIKLEMRGWDTSEEGHVARRYKKGVRFATPLKVQSQKEPAKFPRNGLESENELAEDKSTTRIENVGEYSYLAEDLASLFTAPVCGQSLTRGNIPCLNFWNRSLPNISLKSKGGYIAHILHEKTLDAATSTLSITLDKLEMLDKDPLKILRNERQQLGRWKYCKKPEWSRPWKTLQISHVFHFDKGSLQRRILKTNYDLASEQGMGGGAAEDKEVDLDNRSDGSAPMDFEESEMEDGLAQDRLMTKAEHVSEYSYLAEDLATLCADHACRETLCQGQIPGLDFWNRSLSKSSLKCKNGYIAHILSQKVLGFATSTISIALNGPQIVAAAPPRYLKKAWEQIRQKRCSENSGRSGSLRRQPVDHGFPLDKGSCRRKIFKLSDSIVSELGLRGGAGEDDEVDLDNMSDDGAPVDSEEPAVEPFDKDEGAKDDAKIHLGGLSLRQLCAKLDHKINEHFHHPTVEKQASSNTDAESLPKVPPEKIRVEVKLKDEQVAEVGSATGVNPFAAGTMKHRKTSSLETQDSSVDMRGGAGEDEERAPSAPTESHDSTEDLGLTSTERSSSADDPPPYTPDIPSAIPTAAGPANAMTLDYLMGEGALNHDQAVGAALTTVADHSTGATVKKSKMKEVDVADEGNIEMVLSQRVEWRVQLEQDRIRQMLVTENARFRDTQRRSEMEEFERRGRSFTADFAIIEGSRDVLMAQPTDREDSAMAMDMDERITTPPTITPGADSSVMAQEVAEGLFHMNPSRKSRKRGSDDVES